MNGSNVNFSLVLNNDKGSLEKIVLEPWAEEIILKAGGSGTHSGSRTSGTTGHRA